VTSDKFVRHVCVACDCELLTGLLVLLLDTHHERKLKFVSEILVLILVVNPQ
jgi:hypothetical protein